jgi:SAM-dependent methyltransferase
VVRLLVERKGARRAPLYFPFKEERARLFLDPLLRYLRERGARDLSVLEVGASFGHMTEYLAEQTEIAEIHCFDTDPAFVDIVRAKVEEQGLRTVKEVRLFGNDETRRLPWPDARFDLVLVVGVVEHLPARNRRAQVDESTGCWRLADTSRSSTPPTGSSRWRPTRSACRSCSGCRRVSPTPTRAWPARGSSGR